MITRFYKIINKKQETVYVGVTTKSLSRRFKQHIRSKNLDSKQYSIVEIDKIVHGSIKSLEDYYREKRKVIDLEKAYIQKERINNSLLLNISPGGEWGTNILKTIMKEKFFENNADYLLFLLKYKNHIKIKSFLKNWVLHTNQNKIKYFLQSWIGNKAKHKTKRFLLNWISHANSSRVKSWLKHWITHRNASKTKTFLQCWIMHREYSKARRWLKTWILARSISKTKVFLRNWSFNKGNIYD